MRLMLTADEAELCKQVGRQFPRYVEMLDRLRTAEMESMAVSSSDHFGTFKGRVSVLTELRQQVRPV